MKVSQLVKSGSLAAALALTAIGGAAHAQSTGYVPPESTSPYVPPVVPPETTPGGPTTTVTTTTTATATGTGTATATGGQGGQGGQGGTGIGGEGGQGGIGNGGSVAGSGNSSNSYNSEFTAYPGGPALAAAVNGCLSVGSTSIGVGFAGISFTGGRTHTTYNEQCARDNMQIALLNFLVLNKDQPEVQALAIVALTNISPDFAAAVTQVTEQYVTAMAACNRQIGSPLDILSGGRTCTIRFNSTIAASATAQPAPITIDINIDNTSPAATTGGATRPRVAARPRAAATGTGTGARGTTTVTRPNGGCPEGTRPVTTCQIVPRTR